MGLRGCKRGWRAFAMGGGGLGLLHCSSRCSCPTAALPYNRLVQVLCAALQPRRRERAQAAMTQWTKRRTIPKGVVSLSVNGVALPDNSCRDCCTPTVRRATSRLVCVLHSMSMHAYLLGCSDLCWLYRLCHLCYPTPQLPNLPLTCSLRSSAPARM